MLLRDRRQRLAKGFLIRRLVPLALAFGALEVRAQQSVIPEAQSCARCRIVVTDSVLLDFPKDGSVTGIPLRVRRDSRGRLWVLQQDGGLPALYSTGGKFLQLVGGKGTGPGEFSQAFDVAPVAGDSVLVLDARTFRITVLTQDLRVGRTIASTVPLSEPMVKRWPREVIVAATIASPDRAGFPIHSVSLAGPVASIQSSFTVSSGDLRPDDLYHQRFLFAAARDGGFWAAWASGYDLFHFQSKPEPTMHVQRRSSWMGTVPASLGSPSRAPSAFVKGIAGDQHGLIWVLVSSPKSSWKQGWPTGAEGVREVMASAMDLTQMYSTKIEVLDMGKSQVVARHDLPEFPISVVRDKQVAFYVRNGDSERVVVRSFALQR